MKTKSYREGLLKRLKNTEYAVGYLTEVLAHESSECFLIALKDFIDAKEENISYLAEKAGLTRQAVYQALSESGNPRFSTITQILRSLNLKFAGLEMVHPEKEAA